MLESCVRDVKALLCVSLAVVIAYAFGALDGFVRRCLVRCVADGLGTRARLASASLSLSSGTLESQERRSLSLSWRHKDAR